MPDEAWAKVEDGMFSIVLPESLGNSGAYWQYVGAIHIDDIRPLLLGGINMANAQHIGDVILDDFVRPTIRRLSKQLKCNINLNVETKFEGAIYAIEVVANSKSYNSKMHGEMRILASDTAIPNRYKYDAQCIFENLEKNAGFSGFRIGGIVFPHRDSEQHEYSGYSYSYNEWDWGKKLRDF